MPALSPSIGLPHATAMVVGTIIGASIFVQPSEVSRAVPTFGGMLLVWVAAGALTWFGASICAELSSAFPQTGGVYVFLREMFSPAVGFLWGWAMFWSMHSGIIAAIAMVVARYAAGVVPVGDGGIRAIAVGAIVGLSAINYLGVRPGSAVQTGLTLTKVVPKAAAAISTLVVISALGAMTGIILAGPRVYYAMSHDGLLFGWMGAIHPRFQSPHVAIAAQAVWASVLVLPDTYRALFTRVVYTEWIFFGALALGAMRLRGSAAYAPAFRAWGFPIAPLLFASICLAIVLSQIVADPVESVSGLALVAVGLPVYYIWRRTGVGGWS